MLIEINTDKNIESSEGLIVHFTDTINHSLSRFDELITRIEVHLSDENGSKEGGDDKRCLLEARLKGLAPIAVTNHAATVHQAVKGAADKLHHALEKVIGQKAHH